MKITRSDGEKLVIVDFPWGWGFFLVVIPTGLLTQVFVLSSRPVSTKDKIFSAVFALLFYGMAALMIQRSAFTFDRARRELDWSRFNILGHKGGTIPFHHIQSAVIQTMSGDKGGVDYRVALKLADGTLPGRDDLPLTVVYSGGAGAICHKVRDAINDVLGVRAAVAVQQEEADIRALIEDGRMIDAIARVRQDRSCSLAEAKAYVESLGRSA